MPLKSVSYAEYVVRVVSQMTKDKGAIDQLSLRESTRDRVASTEHILNLIQVALWVWRPPI